MSVVEGAAPDWFTRAVATPGASGFAQVEGCAIHYLRWGDPASPGLLLIPPAGGHAHWFDHVAPLFADQFHVVAMDPAGCGDSGRREAYTTEQTTREIIAVCDDAGLFAAATPPTLVGHSGGAQFALRAALAEGERLLGVMAIDGLRYARLEKDHAIKVLEGPRPAPRPARVHATREDAVARFRLSPAPLIEVGHSYVLDHIAGHSYRQVEGGWTSKHDPAQTATVSLAFELKDALKDLRCRSAAIYAEHSHLADETAPAAIAAASNGKTTAFRIPGTSHYPMIDSPFAFVAAIKGVALAWVAEAATKAIAN
jgi:pimeloyl-ACP methyl ester carboxylesterase